MSVLPAQHIRDWCLDHRLVFPFHEKTIVNGMSYGLGAAGYDVRADHGGRPYAILHPGDFLLAATLERFVMPHTLVGFVCDKSTWVRRGVEHIGTTVIEPGWEGFLTLELTNHHRHNPVTIRAGDPIAQIVFHELAGITWQPYDGKYQNQPAGPQEAIEE